MQDISKAYYNKIRGRFAPSPSGRMHLGNVWSALLAWLSIRSKDGIMVLRIEDLDPQRSQSEYTQMIINDLLWLGLDWDEGPLKDGVYLPYYQDERRDLYENAVNELKSMGLIYPCYCSRAERLAASAPHRGDGGRIYTGKCKKLTLSEQNDMAANRLASLRLSMPDETVQFDDMVFGRQFHNLMHDSGDIIIKRADGVHAYQLAVSIDDGLMNIGEVVRGADLLNSSPCQIHILKLLGFNPPKYGHVPLLVGDDGNRLSKRHGDTDLGMMIKSGWKSTDIIGLLAWKAGMTDHFEPVTPGDLIKGFSIDNVGTKDVMVKESELHK